MAIAAISPRIHGFLREDQGRNYNNLVIRIKVLLYNKIPVIARKLRVSINGWNGSVGQTIKCILMELSTNMPSAETDTFCPKIISTPAP